MKLNDPIVCKDNRKTDGQVDQLFKALESRKRIGSYYTEAMNSFLTAQKELAEIDLVCS